MQKGPFIYYVSKKVGGLGQKMAIFAIYYYFTIYADVGGWAGLKKPKTCWRNTWMVPNGLEQLRFHEIFMKISSTDTYSVLPKSWQISTHCGNQRKNGAKLSRDFENYLEISKISKCNHERICDILEIFDFKWNRLCHEVKWGKNIKIPHYTVLLLWMEVGVILSHTLSFLWFWIWILFTNQTAYFWKLV